MSQTTKVVKGFMLAYPNAIEEAYLSNLQKMISKLKAVTTRYLIKSGSFISSYNKSIRQDDIVDEFNMAIKTIQGAIAKQILNLVRFLPRSFDRVRLFTKQGIKRSIIHIENASSNIQVVFSSNIVKNPKMSVLRKMW